MGRRDKALEKYLLAMQAGAAGATEDPFAGIPPQLEAAHLFATGAPRSGGWGFDGTPGSAARIHVHRDGHSTAHVGACAIEPEEPLQERLVRLAGMDRDEAEVWRALCATPSAGGPSLAASLGLTLRTYQRREAMVRSKLELLQVELERVRWAAG